MTARNVELTMLDVVTIRVALDGMLMLARKGRRSARVGSRIHREASESVVAVEAVLAKLPEVPMCDAAIRQALSDSYEAATSPRN
jgi:hypothetical protein